VSCQTEKEFAKARGFKAMRLECQLMPQGVIVRPWKFKSSTAGSKTHLPTDATAIDSVSGKFSVSDTLT